MPTPSRAAPPLAALVLMVALSAAPAAQGASPGTASGRLVETSTGPYTAGDTYEVVVQLKAEPGVAGLGTSSVVLDFDPAFATFAEAPAEGEGADYEFLQYQGSQTTHTGGFAGYNSTVRRTNPSRLTVTVDLGFTSDGTVRLSPTTSSMSSPSGSPSPTPTLLRPLYSKTVQLFTGPGARYENGAFAGVGESGVTLVLDGPEGWYQLAVPAEGVTVGGLLGPIWTQGYEGSDAPDRVISVYTYDETVVCENEPPEPPCPPTLGYVPVGSAADPVPPGTGLYVYVYADDDHTRGGVQGGFSKDARCRGG